MSPQGDGLTTSKSVLIEDSMQKIECFAKQKEEIREIKGRLNFLIDYMTDRVVKSHKPALNY